MPGAGWFADPSGLYRLRYWDGVGWTAYLSDGVATFIDPLPDAIPVNGTPGASAMAVHQRRETSAASRRESSGHEVENWRVGAEGEQLLARYLQRGAGLDAIFLHDRRVPRTRGNIDHLAIARNGVWVIDAKNYRGQVRQHLHRDGATAEVRLLVDKRDRTDLADNMQWQVERVREALGDVPVAVTPAICFVGTWDRHVGPFQTRGDVWVVNPTHLVELLRRPGPYERDVGGLIAARLTEAFPEK